MRQKRDFTENPALYTVSWATTIVVAVILCIGYISNIAKLFMIPETLLMLVLRMFGLLIPPLGGVLGYL